MSANEIYDCQMCGNALDPDTIQDACGFCQKEGPFCVRCLQHHHLHCQGTTQNKEIEYLEDCSDCEENDQEGDDDEDVVADFIDSP